MNTYLHRISILILIAPLFACSTYQKSFSDNTKREASSVHEDLKHLGKLNWGLDPSTQSPWTVEALKKQLKGQSPLSQQLRNVLSKATKATEADVELQAVQIIEHESVLPTDPKYKASETAIKGIPTLFYWSLCARIAEGENQIQCQGSAKKALLSWVNTYVPSGNPIDDRNLILVIASLDLMMPMLSEIEVNTARKWILDFTLQGDVRYKSDDFQKTTRKVSNHNTWRLVIRIISSRVLNESSLIQENSDLLSEHIQENLVAPSNWKPDSNCSNNANESQYGSFDFRYRDALGYHVFNLEGFQQIAIFSPENIEPQNRQIVESAFIFIKPYFEKTKEHVEYVCTKVRFDLDRKNAGVSEFQNKKWNPDRARTLFRLARSTYPTIRPWTEVVVDETYHPWIKLLATLHAK